MSFFFVLVKHSIRLFQMGQCCFKDRVFYVVAQNGVIECVTPSLEKATHAYERLYLEPKVDMFWLCVDPATGCVVDGPTIVKRNFRI